MNEMIKTIEEHGVNFTAKTLAEYINQKILTDDVAIQFILEELEAASQGNEMAKLFAATSGFDEDDYMGAMNNSFEEIDVPQQEIQNLCMMLYPNQDLMTELRIRTVDNILKDWKFGKYSVSIGLIDVVNKQDNHEWGLFANITNDLGEYAKEYGELDLESNSIRFMAYAYARRTAAAGLYLQGYWNREYYNHASQFFKSTQLTTGYSKEFQEKAAEESIELLLTYSLRLSKNMISKITSAVELNKVVPAYENKIHYDFDRVLDLFEEDSQEKIINDKHGNVYKEIISPYTGRIWLDRNLGASRVAQSFDDTESYGDYYQWGRDSDGHEKINSLTTFNVMNSENARENRFILRPLSDENSNYDWLRIQNNNLWQGLEGINNPCPVGYRLPTLEEITEEIIVCQGAKNINDAFGNFLKIPSAGCRDFDSGRIIETENKIFLWSSDIQEQYAIYLGFDDEEVYRRTSGRSGGCAIRCIKD